MKTENTTVKKEKKDDEFKVSLENEYANNGQVFADLHNVITDLCNIPYDECFKNIETNTTTHIFAKRDKSEKRRKLGLVYVNQCAETLKVKEVVICYIDFDETYEDGNIIEKTKYCIHYGTTTLVWYFNMCFFHVLFLFFL